MKNVIEIKEEVYRGTGIKRNGDTVSINLELDKNNMWSAEVRDEFGDIEHIYTDRTKDKVLSSFSDADIVKIKWNDGKVWNINEEKRMKNVIEIKEEVSIIQEDGTKVILEKGDRVEILEQQASTIGLESLINVLSLVNKQNKSVSSLIDSLSNIPESENPLYMDEWGKLFNKYNI